MDKSDGADGKANKHRVHSKTFKIKCTYKVLL